MPRISRIYEFDDDHNNILDPNYTRSRSTYGKFINRCLYVLCSLSIYLAGESPATQMVNRMLVMTPSLACSVGLVNMKGYLAHIQEDVLSLLWGNSPR